MKDEAPVFYPFAGRQGLTSSATRRTAEESLRHWPRSYPRDFDNEWLSANWRGTADGVNLNVSHCELVRASAALCGPAEPSADHFPDRQCTASIALLPRALIHRTPCCTGAAISHICPTFRNGARILRSPAPAGKKRRSEQKSGPSRFIATRLGLQSGASTRRSPHGPIKGSGHSA